MKKVFSLQILAMIFTLALSSFATKGEESKLIGKSLLPKKQVKGTINLSGGCSVTYDVTVDYSIFPPRLNSIHGTVIFSGGCTGTQTFRATADVTSDKQITNTEIESDDSVLEGVEFESALQSELNAKSLWN